MKDTTIIDEVPISSQEYNNILNIQNKILSLLALSSSKKDVLEALCLMAEESLPNSIAFIMLKDASTGLMSVLSAPSVPEVGHEALKDLKPGPGGGSCGNAVFKNEAQYVADTFTDARWEDIRDIAVDFNLCSCWSMPVQDKGKNAIGTFALSSFEHRSPSAFHKKLLEMAASVVNIVLQMEENEIKLDDSLYKDSLTGLANKTKLEKNLQEDTQRTLVLLDINNFSFINTAYGLNFGDKLLQNVAEIFRNNFSQATFFRINSDEFVWLFDTIIDIDQEVEKVKTYFYNKTLFIDGINLNVSFTYAASYGRKNLLRDAASALKYAKNTGKNSLCIFDEGKVKNTKSFVEANAMLFDALKEGKFIPFYQGIRNNNTQKIDKYEVLARINIDGDIISPYKFLEPARLSGVLFEITKLMIDKSFKMMSENNYSFSINITEDDLARSYLEEYLSQKSLEYKIKPNRVILEILEGVSTEGKNSHVQQLNRLKEDGYKLAIDDFGAEYSNFERVLDLDLDFLKIDAKYIKDIDINNKSLEIVRSIVFFAKNANIPCIAEFVHNEDVQKIVDDLGIDFSQGFYFSEPQNTPIISE